MFGGSKTSKQTQPAQRGQAPQAAGAAGLNSLVKGTTIEGAIKASSDIRIEGFLKGDLDCNAKVIIGPSGRIEGTVRCATAMIEGHFNGDLSVSELLEVRDGARVEGEVSYGQIKIDAGAAILGSMRMEKPDLAKASKPSQNGQAKMAA